MERLDSAVWCRPDYRRKGVKDLPGLLLTMSPTVHSTKMILLLTSPASNFVALIGHFANVHFEILLYTRRTDGKFHSCRFPATT
jgi:hypothetical protein